VTQEAGKLEAAVAHAHLDQAQSTLSALKVAITSLSTLPPNPPTASGLPERELACGVFEQAVLLSVAQEDLASFQRHMSQLKPFYSDPSSDTRPLRCTMLGLNLMNLLVENRLAEFHSEVELLSESERASPAVAFPMQIEEHLMMGSYNRVLMARKSMPAPTFELFMELLADTVRTSIAECAEVSYSQLSVSAAMDMMVFDSAEKFHDFVKESFESWTIANGTITFRPTGSNIRSDEVPSTRLIKETIAYATELERIV